mgnify:CR=1 FL=1
MIKITAARTKEEFEHISMLADKIWREHYTPIIGAKQVDYMVKNYQSATAMYAQYLEGYEYYTIHLEHVLMGYLATKKQEESLFLSKIYIDKDFRGQQFGKQAMDFVIKKAISLNCKSVSLGVNRFNTSAIEAYKAMGFKNVGEMITDIGNGFIMDDYKMVKLI